MTQALSRSEELRNDLENLHFTRRYYVGVLAELEQLGRTHTEDFKRLEANLRVLNHNVKRLEELLAKEEAKEFDEEIDDPYYFSCGMHW